MALDLQLYVFSVTVLAGIVLAAGYDFYRMARAVFGWSRIKGDLADLIFVAVATLFLLWLLLASTWASLGAYTIPGLLTGLWFYFFAGSPFLGPVFRKVWRAAAWLLAGLSGAAAWTWRQLARLMPARRPPQE